VVVNGAPKIPAKESRRGNVLVRWHLRSDTHPSSRKFFVCPPFVSPSRSLPTTYNVSTDHGTLFLSCKARACTFSKSCALILVSDRIWTHDHSGSHSYREPSNDRSESPLPCRTFVADGNAWNPTDGRTDGRGATRTSPASGSALVAGAQYRLSSIISSTHFPLMMKPIEHGPGWVWVSSDTSQLANRSDGTTR